MQVQTISSTKNHCHLRFHFVEGEDFLDDIPGHDYFEEVTWNNAKFAPSAIEDDVVNYSLHDPVRTLYPKSWGALDFWIEKDKR